MESQKPVPERQIPGTIATATFAGVANATAFYSTLWKIGLRPSNSEYENNLNLALDVMLYTSLAVGAILGMAAWLPTFSGNLRFLKMLPLLAGFVAPLVIYLVSIQSIPMLAMGVLYLLAYLILAFIPQMAVFKMVKQYPAGPPEVRTFHMGQQPSVPEPILVTPPMQHHQGYHQQAPPPSYTPSPVQYQRDNPHGGKY